MKRFGKPLAACLGLCAFVTLADEPQGATTDNPYESIWVRNSFGLKPPPPPPEPPAPPPKPAPNIKLTGITSILYPKKAMFALQEPNGKTEYLTLGEGDKQGAVEVLTIDEDEGSVLIKNAGEELTMTFESHGMKPPQGAPMQPAPGMVPGAPVQGMPFQPNQPAQPGLQPVPPGYPPAQNGGFQPVNQPPSGTAPGSVPLPVRPIRSTATPQGQTIMHAPADDKLTFEQKVILKQVNDAVAKDGPPPLPVD